MSKCKFIDKCTHATGWCNSEKTWKTCEYIFDICKVTDLMCSYCNPVCEHRKEDIMAEKKFKCGYCGKEYDTSRASY